MKFNINIFEYFFLKFYRIFRDGIEEVYVYLDFFFKGDKFVFVGSVLDYMLIVWDWRNE